ncbi:MAG: hypothetical protein KC454_07860 [Flavobacteriales bacterium]|nr:hypothetical protein [Flavobacteriales bacterium]
MKTLLLFGAIALSINSFAQNVNIPDANFKYYLVWNTPINTNGDSEIQISEAADYTGSIECSNKNISDLTGIEAFTNLTYLDCSNNSLASLDLTQNIDLSFLSCYNNQITSLNVTENILLCCLYCGNNQLTSLDVTQNIDLLYFTCEKNQLTSLDVTQNPVLDIFGCGWNQLTSLDVTQNSVLNRLGLVHNQITVLDVTQNTILYSLQCEFNQLTSLDVTQNSDLSALNCHDNQFTSLDLSQNPALTFLKCWNNELVCLNLKNGNNHNMMYYNFVCTYNPNLTCIEVDDVAYSNTNWTNIDPQTSFSTNCNNACSSSTVDINELSNTPKQLIKITDLIGRETTFKPNTPLIYIYSDGTAEKVFKVE